MDETEEHCEIDAGEGGAGDGDGGKKEEEEEETVPGPDWRRTVIQLHRPTQPGEDVFVAGGRADCQPSDGGDCDVPVSGCILCVQHMGPPPKN